MGEIPQPNLESRPAFDGGFFRINFLSTSPKGFEVHTGQRLLRHEPGTPLPNAQRVHTQENMGFRVTNVYPRNGESLENFRQRILERKTPGGKPEIKPEDIILEGDHLRLMPGFAPLVGPRNLRAYGNTLFADIQPVTFRTYRAISDPSRETAEDLEQSNPGATAAILFTTEPDGTHKIVLQHRSKNNYFYGDIPGASIAGYLDAYLDGRNKGKIMPVNTNYIKGNNLKEMDEELGLSPEDISDVSITGVATENMKHHTEFLLSGISRLSAAEIAQKAAKRAQEKRPNDTFDFEGNFAVIDGTPEAIETLITQVKCPLPPTHAAAFVAAGYSLMLEREGLEAAESWKQRIEQGVSENYRQINSMVVTYWAQHSQEAQEHPLNKPPHNIFAYDPAYTPAEQGLPSFDAELLRVGLLTSA